MSVTDTADRASRGAGVTMLVRLCDSIGERSSEARKKLFG
jgi:hypothetical protein